MSTRRQFLAISSAAAAVSTLPASLFAQFPREVFSNANIGAYQQGLLTQATFLKHVGSVFKVFLPDGKVSYLTLLEVQDRTPQGSSAAQTRATTSTHLPSLRVPVAAAPNSAMFDLRFAVDGPPLAQASYTLDHGILGRFAVFLVPGTSENGAPTCGASFNYSSGPTPAVQPRQPVALPILQPVPSLSAPGQASANPRVRLAVSD